MLPFVDTKSKVVLKTTMSVFRGQCECCGRGVRTWVDLLTQGSLFYDSGSDWRATIEKPDLCWSGCYIVF